MVNTLTNLLDSYLLEINLLEFAKTIQKVKEIR
jgi:hypothetical protein